MDAVGRLWQWSCRCGTTSSVVGASGRTPLCCCSLNLRPLSGVLYYNVAAIFVCHTRLSIVLLFGAPLDRLLSIRLCASPASLRGLFFILAGATYVEKYMCTVAVRKEVGRIRVR